MCIQPSFRRPEQNDPVTVWACTLRNSGRGAPPSPWPWFGAISSCTRGCQTGRGEGEKQPMGGTKAVLVLTRHAPLQMQTKRLLGAVALALCVASAYGGFFVSCPDDDFPRQ